MIQPQILLAAALSLIAMDLQGQRRVEGFDPGAIDVKPSHRPSLFAWDNKVLFLPWTMDLGYEPWISDGTLEGTFPLGDFVPGWGGLWDFQAIEFGGECYFFNSGTISYGADGQPFWGLFRTDGTRAGTTVVKSGISFYEAKVAGGTLYLL